MNEIEISAGDELTSRQQAFCEEYLRDLNGTKAAIRAGYGKAGAHVQAHVLLSNHKVMNEVARLKKERAIRTGIDADWVLSRLAEETNADVADLYDENGHILPVSEWPLIWRQGLVAGIEVTTEYETVDGKKDAVGKVTKIKVSDRVRRIELIGRHIGVQAFRDQVGHTGTIGLVAIDPASLTDEQLKALASIPTLDKTAG